MIPRWPGFGALYEASLKKNDHASSCSSHHRLEYRSEASLSSRGLQASNLSRSKRWADNVADLIWTSLIHALHSSMPKKAVSHKPARVSICFSSLTTHHTSNYERSYFSLWSRRVALAKLEALHGLVSCCPRDDFTSIRMMILQIDDSLHAYPSLSS